MHYCFKITDVLAHVCFPTQICIPPPLWSLEGDSGLVYLSVLLPAALWWYFNWFSFHFTVFKSPRHWADPNNFWVPHCGTAGLEKEVIIWEQEILCVFCPLLFRQFSGSLFFQASLLADPKASLLSRLSAPDFLEGEISKECVTDRNIRWMVHCGNRFYWHSFWMLLHISFVASVLMNNVDHPKFMPVYQIYMLHLLSCQFIHPCV